MHCHYLKTCIIRILKNCILIQIPVSSPEYVIKKGSTKVPFRSVVCCFTDTFGKLKSRISVFLSTHMFYSYFWKLIFMCPT